MGASGEKRPWQSVTRVGRVQVVVGVRQIPDTQEADAQTEEDATKVRNFSADIMKESRRIWKREASRNSLVKMSLGLMSPGMWQRSISLAWMLSQPRSP